jgi:tRNA uridine 5-carboxymethylaminomethyl modification enzyme
LRGAHLSYDILVIGGGHAGVEAVYAAAQFKLKIGLLSMPGVDIASTPCNPSIGGVGKGQVVREIDVLGGLMPKIADRSAIQVRVLNESKGPAVQSTRFQVDKAIYAKLALAELEKIENLDIVRKRAQRISKLGDLFHVELSSGEILTAKRLIVTTGTFLAGKLHVGDESIDGGRHGCERSIGLSDLFSQVKTLPIRFKTGTPPRIKKGSLDFSKMQPQESDPKTENFHLLHPLRERFLPQVACFITHTNTTTMETVRANKHRSPMYNGKIKAVGARYCPSLEDKAFRYPDRNRHHVFVEPETLDGESIYPNGISSSLPREVQEAFLRSIPGLERAEILVHGYAVEYDVVDTLELDSTLQYRGIEGLYFAGQVNGTSGYEEAAGQGLVAGINAALASNSKAPLIIDRRESYIGVMIDDLVTLKRDEPYRLFTARAENRLHIREDNTVVRMAKYRMALNLSLEIDLYLKRFMCEYDLLSSMVNSYVVRKRNNTGLSEVVKSDLRGPIVALSDFLNEVGVLFSDRVISSVALTTKYSGYINRANQENLRVSGLAGKKVSWERIMRSANISTECKQRIEEHKPSTFGQVQRIEGIRPATLVTIASEIF